MCRWCEWQHIAYITTSALNNPPEHWIMMQDENSESKNRFMSIERSTRKNVHNSHYNLCLYYIFFRVLYRNNWMTEVEAFRSFGLSELVLDAQELSKMTYVAFMSVTRQLLCFVLSSHIAHFDSFAMPMTLT